MNNYLSTFLKMLKYVGVILLVGYLFMIVKVVYTQADEDISFTERIANAIVGSLYAYIIYISVFISNLRYGQNYPYPKL